MLPSEIIQSLYKETKQTYYERVLPPVLILWGFIYQRLNSDHSCDAAWSYLSSESVQRQFGLKKAGTQLSSESTSGYCQARQRLPLSVARQVLAHTSKAIADKTEEAGRWHGWRVNLFDGSTLQLAASAELQKHYGTNHNQYRKGHWPLMRLVAGFDFSAARSMGSLKVLIASANTHSLCHSFSNWVPSGCT